MSGADWTLVAEIFADALEQPPEARSAFVAERVNAWAVGALAGPAHAAAALTGGASLVAGSSDPPLRRPAPTGPPAPGLDAGHTRAPVVEPAPRPAGGGDRARVVADAGQPNDERDVRRRRRHAAARAGADGGSPRLASGAAGGASQRVVGRVLEVASGPETSSSGGMSATKDH